MKKCVYCQKRQTKSHACIEEVLRFMAIAIAQLKEDQVGGSGENWLDNHTFLMEQVIRQSKSSPK